MKIVIKKWFLALSICLVSLASPFYLLAEESPSVERGGLEVNPSVRDEALHFPHLLKAFYVSTNEAPIWIKGSQVSRQAHEFLKILLQADKEGLNPLTYHTKLLEELLKKKEAKDLIDLEILLSDALATYASHALFGQFHPETGRLFIPKEEDLLQLKKVLQEVALNQDVKSIVAKLFPQNLAYFRLKGALYRYQKIAQKNDWHRVTDGPKLTLGDTDNRIGSLRERLYREGDLDTLASEKEKNYFDNDLDDALRRYQKRHGLLEDGVFGKSTLAAMKVLPEHRVCQIRVNLDRLRALNRVERGGRYILINVPAFKLQVIENHSPVLEMKVIVGRRDRKTPFFQSQITSIILNPHWYVPKSIAIKDKLPDIQKDPDYLAKHQMKLIQGSGEEAVEVDPQTVDWTLMTPENFNYRIVQDPGKQNALGTLKFMFPNKYDVYLHDTSEPQLFQKEVRSLSSGCIRVEKPLELAQYVLSGSEEGSKERISLMIDSGAQKVILLPERISIYTTYQTAWVDEGGEINFRNDIYRYDQTPAKTLCPQS